MSKWKCRNPIVGIWSWKKYSIHKTDINTFALYRKESFIRSFFGQAEAMRWAKIERKVRKMRKSIATRKETP